MISRREAMLGGAATMVLAGCTSAVPTSDTVPSILDVRDDRFLSLFPTDAAFETLGTGYGWSEGPAWDAARQALYFTDVPGNTAYRWSREDGVSVFLQPSGAESVEGFREPGANGLAVSGEDRLLICNHGLRRVEAMDIQTKLRTPLTTEFEGKLYNSPNDLIEASDGTIYFTDPPYGLAEGDASPLKEMDVNGVYRLDPDGSVTRLFDDMTRPNGIALSPDERSLYITNSDPENAKLRVADLSEDGEVLSHRWLFDTMPFMAEDAPGLPDGMAITTDGLIVTTGPAGIFVITPEGELLGRILTGRATANCTFGEDGRTLFITSHDHLLRLETEMMGLGWG